MTTDQVRRMSSNRVGCTIFSWWLLLTPCSGEMLVHRLRSTRRAWCYKWSNSVSSHGEDKEANEQVRLDADGEHFISSRVRVTSTSMCCGVWWDTWAYLGIPLYICMHEGMWLCCFLNLSLLIIFYNAMTLWALKLHIYPWEKKSSFTGRSFSSIMIFLV